MLGSELNLVTTLIGFGMSATFIILVCARLICGRVESNGAAPCVVRLRRPVPRRGSRSHGERLCPNYCATVLTLRVSKQGREVIPAQLKPRTMLFYCKIIYYRAHGVLIASENIHSLVPDSQIRMMSFVSDNLSFQFLMLWDWQDGGMDNLVSYIIS
jgi:hypothetical protein